MKTLSLRLSEAVYEEVRKKASLESRSINSMISWILMDFLSIDTKVIPEDEGEVENKRTILQAKVHYPKERKIIPYSKEKQLGKREKK